MTRSRNFIALLLLFVFFSYHTALRAQSSSPDQPAPPAGQQQPNEQQPAPPPEKPADQQPVPEKPDAPTPKTSDASLEHRVYNRILGIIPNFIATEDTPENRKPLTPCQKYDLAFREMFDYSAQIGIGIGAAIDQGFEGRSGFGQGWDAYGKRFVADEAGNISGTFITTGFLPHILKQDPRFFRRGRGGIPKRAWYAFTRVVVTRSDAGKPVFNTSNVFGSLAEDGISTLFYPGYNHTVAGTFRGWGYQMLQDGGFNILSEFYPDVMDPILRRLHKNPVPHARP